MLTQDEINHEDRLIFRILFGHLDFVAMLAAVKHCLEPDSIDAERVTSCCIESGFVKDGLTVRLCYLRTENRTPPGELGFTLFPLGPHTDADNERLRRWVRILCSHLKGGEERRTQMQEKGYDGGLRFKPVLRGLDFETIVDGIKACLEPDVIDEQEEYTSWTTGICFVKDGLNVYFEEVHFGDTNHEDFGFELLPFGVHADVDNARLRGWVETLCAYLQARSSGKISQSML